MKKQSNRSLIGFNAIVLLMACSFFLTSCTSLQQTTTAATDDLYFTPSKEAETSTKTTARNNSAEAEVTEEAEYQDYQNYQDDRYLRLKVANRNRWSSIDDFGYWNNPSFRVGFGMGYGGFGGWGGWNPYYAGYWNPYRPIYYGGGVGNFPMQRNNYTPRAMQTSTPALAAYRTNRNYNNSNNFSNNTNGSTRYTGNPNLNSGFGNLLRRVTTNNANANQANSFDRPARYFNNGGFSNSNQNKSSNSTTNTNSAPSVNNNAGGRSGGFNSSGSAPSSRPPRGGN